MLDRVSLAGDTTMCWDPTLLRRVLCADLASHRVSEIQGEAAGSLRFGALCQ